MFRLLDFGIASCRGRGGSRRPPLTQFYARALTRTYASPELCEANGSMRQATSTRWAWCCTNCLAAAVPISSSRLSP